MKKQYLITSIISLLLLTSIKITAQNTNFSPKAFISISGNIGRHNVRFIDFADAPGASFGFQVSVGIYALQKEGYEGGLHFTLVEGASYNKNRRQLSEDFDLPNPDFDKHHIFKFAQFRSSNIGWFSKVKVGELELFHQLGIGIFGTTELDQLYDFGLHNSLGVITGKQPDKLRFMIGVSHDKQVGSGNPNYTMSNIGVLFGGRRSF